MRWLREVLSKMAAAIFPWVPRHERRAAIAAAAADREHAEAEAKHAKVVARQLRQMTENGYAQDIAQQILRGHQ